MDILYLIYLNNLLKLEVSILKVIHIKKKKLLTFSSIFLTFILTLCFFTTSFGMQHYYKLDFSTGLVTANRLNVRSGPGTRIFGSKNC